MNLTNEQLLAICLCYISIIVQDEGTDDSKVSRVKRELMLYLPEIEKTMKDVPNEASDGVDADHIKRIDALIERITKGVEE